MRNGNATGRVDGADGGRAGERARLAEERAYDKATRQRANAEELKQVERKRREMLEWLRESGVNPKYLVNIEQLDVAKFQWQGGC